MATLQGRVISEGMVVAPVFVYEKFSLDKLNYEAGSADEELAKYEDALKVATSQLKELFIKALKELGRDKSLLFEVHQMLIQDDDFKDEVRNLIKDGLDAPHAVQKAGQTFADMMLAIDDDYMQQRALDFKDISNRLIRILANVESNTEILEPAIVVADDLEPSETVTFPKDKILGFVLRQGSANSHTAILARGMNVPALIQTPLKQNSVKTGDTVILDAVDGCFITEPSAEQLAEYNDKIAKRKAMLAELKQYLNGPSLTKSGKAIKLYNNIGSLDDIKSVLENGAEGVGLFRSEFLYMGRSSLPTEEEQTKIYTKALQALDGKPLIVRTMDIGADKQVACLRLKKEANPALGKRAVRICLDDKRLFKDQLKALLRASVAGKLSIMVPMIISVDEVRQCKEILAECREELKAANQPFSENIPFGIMIETPAACILADDLAKEVDFFSVGTNDLTQYTLACDRQNDAVAYLYDDTNPAVLSLMKMVAEAANKNGIWAGVCGELASNSEITSTLISYGYTELSISPAKTPIIRRAIAKTE